MSRNLCDTSCRICTADEKAIVLNERPRPLTVADVGEHFFAEYDGLIVARAHCSGCGAKYLAWIDAATNRRLNTGHWRRRDPHDDRQHVDLSFQHSFDDEPAPEDLPAPERLQELHEAEHVRVAREREREAQELLAEARDLYDKAATGKSWWERYRYRQPATES